MTVPDERWLPIPGHDGYEVSDLGRVRSLDRVILKRDGRRQTVHGRTLRAWPEKGYLSVHLGTGPRYLVHRLVLEAFVGPCPPLMEALHGNGDRANACLNNLRWGTPSENAHDRIRHGTCSMTAKTQCPQGHPLAAPNLCGSGLRRGLRECLACVRAKSRIRWLRQSGAPVVPSKQEESDRFYRLIVRGLLDPSPGRGRRTAAEDALLAERR